MKESKIEIIKEISKTVGGRHAWYEAKVKKTGEKIKVRKPLNV